MVIRHAVRYTLCLNITVLFDVVAALEVIPMNELPKDAHPTAKAFFDALDEYNQQQQGGHNYVDDDDTKDDGFTGVTAMKQNKPFMSESLKRKSQSLGWRNRNSQSDNYPVTVLQQYAVSDGDEECRSIQQESAIRIRRRNFSVHQVQRGEVEGTYGTGATVWPAAVVLIKYLERRQNGDIIGNTSEKDNGDICDDSKITLRGRHVIDLGGGTGIASIAAALLGATSVVCTDGAESVVRLAHDNIRHASHQLSQSFCPTDTPLHDTVEELKSNTPEGDHGETRTALTIDVCPIRAQKYWWGEDTPRDLLSGTNHNGLVILVADCVLPKLYPIAPLVQAIDECLRLHDDGEGKCNVKTNSSELSSSFAILSYEHRYYPEYDPRVEFRRLAFERCLDVAPVPRDEMDPVYSLEDVEIWIVRRRRCR